MDTAAFSKLFPQTGEYLMDCDALTDPNCASSDTGYYSACSSLSPASSIDSCCLSPASLQWGSTQKQEATTNWPQASDCFISQAAKKPRLQLPAAPEETRQYKSRSKYPGKKRESASEREKLRMRDLTKGLHRLRTYLPPSVAPAGQTLTKIETLRLTIRYISNLAAQLGLSEELSQEAVSQGREMSTEEAPCQRIEVDTTTCQTSRDMQQCPQGSPIHGQWYQERLQGSLQSSDQYCLPLATSYTNTAPQYLTSTVSYQDMSLHKMPNQVYQSDRQFDLVYFQC